MNVSKNLPKTCFLVQPVANSQGLYFDHPIARIVGLARFFCCRLWPVTCPLSYNEKSP